MGLVSRIIAGIFIELRPGDVESAPMLGIFAEIGFDPRLVLERLGDVDMVHDWNLNGPFGTVARAGGDNAAVGFFGSGPSVAIKGDESVNRYAIGSKGDDVITLAALLWV